MPQNVKRPSGTGTLPQITSDYLSGTGTLPRHVADRTGRYMFLTRMGAFRSTARPRNRCLPPNPKVVTVAYPQIQRS